MPDLAKPSRPSIEAIRAEFAGYVQAYRDLLAAASKASGASLMRIDGAFAAFEPGYFNNLLVALAARFANRRPGGEDDGGGAIAEVRLVVASLIDHGGVMTAGKSAAYSPGTSVLRIDTGDRIALNADDFEAIAAAYIGETEKNL
jgi:hypothetical protein